MQIPAVSGLGEKWQAGRVLRLNTADDVAKRYAERFGVETTPTFILFDAAGKEQRRWVHEAPLLKDLP